LNEASEHINRVVVSGHFIHFSNVFECKEILKKSMATLDKHKFVVLEQQRNIE
jgi:hypothetical protein